MLQELAAEIEKTAVAVVNEIHTALPGRIISYNASKGTATVQPIGKFKTSNGKILDYPIVTEVPIVFPYCHSSSVGITFPVMSGDTCLVIVSEVELDEWRSGASSEGTLRFDLTNAIAIPGLLRSDNKNVKKALEKNAVVIAAPGTEVCVSKNGLGVEVEGVTLAVSKSGIAIGGNLLVDGNISYTGSLKMAEMGENKET